MSATIEQIDTTSLEPLEKPTFVELVFTNITPWWGGKHEPRTIACLDNECREYVYLLPSAQSIKGLLRYILRLAIASFIPKHLLDERGYEVCEDFPFTEGITDSEIIDMKRKIGIPSLLELLFGTIRGGRARQGIVYLDTESSIACHKPYYIGIEFVKRVADVVIRAAKSNNVKSIVDEFNKNFLSCAESYGNVVFRGGTTTIQSVEKRCRNYRDLLLIDDEGKLLSQLIAIPRIRLQLQLSQKVLQLETLFERSEDVKSIARNFIARFLFETQPIRNGCVKTIVRISIARRKVLIGERHIELSEDFIHNLKKLLIYALALGMFVLGIGRAITRGFGKFWLIDARCYEASDTACIQALEDVRNLMKMDSVNENAILNLIAKIIESLKALAEEYIRIVYRELFTLERQVKISEHVEEPAKIPKLYPSETVLIVKIKDRFRHPCPVATREMIEKRAVSNIVRQYCCSSSASIIYIDNVVAGRGIDANPMLFTLAAIGKACTKITWKMYLQVPTHLNPKEPGFRYHTWCLGLPRETKAGKIKTGYIALDSSALRRWKSPIIFTPIISNNITKLVIMLLKYNDIGDAELLHVGTRQTNVFKNIGDKKNNICISHFGFDPNEIKRDIVVKTCECGFRIVDMLLG